MNTSIEFMGKVSENSHRQMSNFPNPHNSQCRTEQGSF